jgi:acetoin utilization deacetylase AcuC-like enzyme
MSFDVFFSHEYVVGDSNRETVTKAAKVAERIAAEFPNVKLKAPVPATTEQLLLSHSEQYVSAFLTGSPLDVASGGLGYWSEDLRRSVLVSTGGVINAVESALINGRSGSLSSGLHHASHSGGAGYCTINGLAIATQVALAGGVKNVGILDVDAHCGGGTIDILRDNPSVRVADVSTNQFDYWRSDFENHQLILESDPDKYLAAVEIALDHLIGVDLILHNAGMDPVSGRSYGDRPEFDSELMKTRENLIAKWCEATSTPIAFVLAGGYASGGLTLDDVADLHMHTIAALASVDIKL